MNKAVLATLCAATFLGGTGSAVAQTTPVSTPDDECEAILAGGEWSPDFQAPSTGTPDEATPAAPGENPPQTESDSPPDRGTTPPVPGPITNPLPVATPTPTPSPTSTPYVTKPNRYNALQINSNGVRYFKGRYTSGYKPQDLRPVKPYSPPGSGIIRIVGGQKIQVSTSDININGLHSSMVNIIDELHITAQFLGIPKPVITSGREGRHSATSLHGSGKALDLRCRTADPCIGWAMTLKQALGPGYDVMWEDWGGPNNHLHIEYDGSA